MLINYILVFTSGSNKMLQLCNMLVHLTPQYEQVTGQCGIPGSDNGISEVSSLQDVTLSYSVSDYQHSEEFRQSQYQNSS
jgi:hypothetical protein